MHNRRVKRRGLPTAVLILAAIVLQFGCSQLPTDQSTLYEQLGGQPGTAELVEHLLIRIIEDPVIADTFAEVNVGRLRNHLEDQFCQLSDGPCEYTGFSMLESHRGMQITDVEFNAIVEDLILAMEDTSIPIATQNRLLAKLAPMHTDIAYR